MAYWECGCVVSVQAVKEIQSVSKLAKNVCVVCETEPIKDGENVIDLNMTDEEKLQKYEELVEKSLKEKKRKDKKRSK